MKSDPGPILLRANLQGKVFLLLYLPPANEVCEGYVSTPVCQSFCSQEGVCLSACWDTHPSWADSPPPRADTPLDRHPLGADPL